MPRRPRVNLVGHPQHVVQRGHNREACFFAEEDYQFYLHWLRESARKYCCAIHAYVLMTNHVHLLLTPATPLGLPRLMQSLNRRYAQYINRSYRRSGSVWEGRYKASLIHAEEYLLACQRYIELNPVRADMVADPGECRWSSYRWHGLGERNDLIADHPLYLALGRNEDARRAAYRALFGPTWKKPPWTTSARPCSRACRWATTASASRWKPRWAGRRRSDEEADPKARRPMRRCRGRWDWGCRRGDEESRKEIDSGTFGSVPLVWSVVAGWR